MIRRAVFLTLIAMGCSIPSPKAPSWDVTATLPMVARTVHVREMAETEDEFFFGDYGPWRFMDQDSVLTSVLSDSMEADWQALQDLPSDEPTTLAIGPTDWGRNPLDEVEGPHFFRAWLEVEVHHNLPGSLFVAIDVEGWDDEMRSCGELHIEVSAEASLDGQDIENTTLSAGDDILSFVNPCAFHSVPDTFSAKGFTGYSPIGLPVGPDAFLFVKVSFLTALDLVFETTTVVKRAEVKQLIISPEDDDLGDADISGDMTSRIKEATFVANVFNNFPVGGEGFFKLAHDSLALSTSPELVVGPFEIRAAPFDPATGKPTGVITSGSEVFLSGDDVEILHNPGPGNDTLYASIEYVLAGTGQQRVCLSAPDSIRLEAAAIVKALVDFEDD